MWCNLEDKVNVRVELIGELLEKFKAIKKQSTNPDSFKAQLTEKTPWGRGYPVDARIEIYSKIFDIAGSYGVPVALCKEPPDVWRRLKLRGKCNCMP